MLKARTRLFVSAAIVLGLGFFGCARPVTKKEKAMKADFYVSPAGNDYWSGRLPEPNASQTDGPFATITRARDAVREARRKEKQPRPFTVLIRGGIYQLNEPIVFTPEDSGSEKAPITYAAYPREKPIISGGRRILGWKRKGKLWCAEIPDVKAGKWYFHQLFINGERRTRARTPNEGYLRTDGPIEPLGDRKKARRDVSKKMGFRYKAGDLKKWRNLGDVNLIVFHSWTASVHWIDSLDEQNRIVRFTAPSQWPIGWWENKQRYIVENYPEALDAAGEWYLDRETGILSYMPLPNEDIEKANIIAPALRQLLLFDGNPEEGKFVRYINIRGLSFQYADWSVKDKGFADGQAGVRFLKGAIHAIGARNCTIENCEIAHIGEYAIWLGKGSKDNRIARCHIHDMGAGGVCIGETYEGKGETTVERNIVDNNFIHSGGRVFREGIGVWVGRSSYNRITHNEICDFFYTGISIGWSWGFAPTSAHDNIAEYNYIHHIGQGVLSDMGGIYTLGISPGTKLRYNLIHDVYSYSYGGWGLYTDEGSSEILLENNIVYNTKTGGFHQHYGRENIVRNNIFAFSREAQIIRSKEEDHISFTFERNIVYCDNGLMLGGRWENGNYRIDNNLYWDTSGFDCDFAGYSLEEWRKKGNDLHSIIADPLFLNPRKYDFRLRKGSPAYKIGFKPIDMSNVGLYGDRDWRNLPRRIKLQMVDLPPLQPEQPIEDDFEKTDVGALPAGATVSGEEKGASIRVTDETAAGGKHSLKITDAAGLSHDWQPHFYYKPNYRRGTGRIRFALRLEKGATLYHEWRDWRGSPYKVGPSLHIEQNGSLRVGDKVLLKLPYKKWIRFEIACKLGRQADGTFDLKVTIEGEKPRAFKALPTGSRDFRRVNWVGFSSTATEKTAFYIDDLKFWCDS